MEKQQQFEYAAGPLFPLASASGLEKKIILILALATLPSIALQSQKL
jgi:hypothetical protein